MEIKSLRIDEMDIKILKELYVAKNVFTSTDLTKAIFKDLKNHRELSDKNSNIIRRMEKLSKYGFLICSKEKNRSVYLVNPDKVIFGTGKMKINTKADDKMVFEFKNLVMIKPNGNWVSYQTE